MRNENEREFVALITASKDESRNRYAKPLVGYTFVFNFFVFERNSSPTLNGRVISSPMAYTRTVVIRRMLGYRDRTFGRADVYFSFRSVKVWRLFISTTLGRNALTRRRYISKRNSIRTGMRPRETVISRNAEDLGWLKFKYNFFCEGQRREIYETATRNTTDRCLPHRKTILVATGTNEYRYSSYVFFYVLLTCA